MGVFCVFVFLWVCVSVCVFIIFCVLLWVGVCVCVCGLLYVCECVCVQRGGERERERVQGRAHMMKLAVLF